MEVHCRATLRWQVLRKPCRRPPANEAMKICPAMRLHCFSLAAAAGCSEEEDDHPSCRFLRPNKVSLSPTNKTASMVLIQQRRPIRRSSKAQTGPRKPLSLNLAPPSFSLESRRDAHLPPGRHRRLSCKDSSVIFILFKDNFVRYGM